MPKNWSPSGLLHRGSACIGSGAEDWAEETDQGIWMVLVGLPFQFFKFVLLGVIPKFSDGEGHVREVLSGYIGMSIAPYLKHFICDWYTVWFNYSLVDMVTLFDMELGE